MITGLEHSRLAGDVIVTAAGEACFFCGELLTDPAITWSGAAVGEIFVHPVCAVELAIRLVRDVHELERRTGARLAWGPTT